MTGSKSYLDTGYDKIERNLEKKYGLPSGIMRAIRTKGERSNADQVSSAGARSVYQIIPATRDSFLKKFGVDAYKGPEQAAEVAALHLKGSFQRGKDYAGAVAEYHGGTDPRNHGPVNRAYVARVTGLPEAGERVTRENLPSIPDVQDISLDDLRSLRASDFDYARRPLGPQKPDPRDSKEARRLDEVLADVGAQGLPQLRDTPNTPDLAAEMRTEVQSVAEQGRKEVAAAPFGEGNPVKNTVHQLIAAGREEWFVPQLARAIDRGNPESDPGYWEWYMQNREEIEGFAKSDREVEQLRGTRSKDDLAWAKKDIERSRENQETLEASGHATALSMIAGLADPVGWAAGAGVGKAFQVAGIGSRALMAGGETALAVGSLGAESAAGNVLFTGMLDAAGRTTTKEDYAMSAAAGLTIGLGLSPIVLRGGADTALARSLEGVQQAAAEKQAGFLVQARRTLGEDAAPDAIAREAERLSTVDEHRFVMRVLGDVPDNERLLSGEEGGLLTADAEAKADIVARYNLEAVVSDETELGLLAEHIARGERMVRENPVDPKKVETILSKAGMESTGLVLMKSQSPVARMVAMSLLESTTGAGGRRSTAAMARNVRERLYNAEFARYDDLYHAFRKGEGVGWTEDFVSQKARRRFNERVFDEVEARADQPAGFYADENPFVREAADLWERGMNKMRVDMQHVDTVGSIRLGSTSRGYMQHKLDARKVLGLSNLQRGRVRDILAKQMEELNGYDAAFSKKLATKYLERAEDAAKGGFDVPMNLRDSQAAEIVRDVLEGMNIDRAEVERLMGKYSRGGASFTKQRMSLDLQADIGDGMKLRDLYNTDLSSLYRGYARRAAGEVALAQYGIMGKKGGLVTVLRRSPERLELATGDRRDDQAYRRVQARGGTDRADQRVAARSGCIGFGDREVDAGQVGIAVSAQ